MKNALKITFDLTNFLQIAEWPHSESPDHFGPPACTCKLMIAFAKGVFLIDSR
jgi:hypothetical protein